jgi:hypothetical protein
VSRSGERERKESATASGNYHHHHLAKYSKYFISAVDRLLPAAANRPAEVAGHNLAEGVARSPAGEAGRSLVAAAAHTRPGEDMEAHRILAAVVVLHIGRGVVRHTASQERRRPVDSSFRPLYRTMNRSIPASS